MTPEKKRWIILIAVSVLLAVGSGVLIYMQKQEIERMRAESGTLTQQIETDRQLIKKTPDLVKEVIVQRETDVVIKGILSDQADVNNLVRTLQEFADDSGVTISGVNPQRASRGEAASEEFKRIGYTLTMEATAFEMMAFMDRVETHARLMSVTQFKVTSARGSRFDQDGDPRHKVQMDLETYVYRPKVAQENRIDQYDRKRDLLVSQISKRTSDLQVPVYDYAGARGRRDPWVDPRIPISGEDSLSVEDQIAIVDDLMNRIEVADDLWDAVENAENLIGEMKARNALEEHIALLEEEMRRVESEGSLSFLPLSNRYENKVVGGLAGLRVRMQNSEGARPGPSVAALREAGESMTRHIEAQEYELALEAFGSLEGRLPLAERDDLKRPLAQSLREMARLSSLVLEFEAIGLEIGGIAVYQDRRPVALINGVAVSEGEALGDDLFVRHIRSNQVEFSFRGVDLALRFD